MGSERVKVVFIGGAGRSGSTLLARLLGQVDDFFCAGELVYIWERGVEANQLCGCGKPFDQCDLWRAVIDELFGSADPLERARAVHVVQRAVARWRYLPFLLSPVKPSSFQATLRKYQNIMLDLYHAVRRVSGKKVIVDASKEIPQAFILATTPGIDFYFVHLVRDSRAVVFSTMRKKQVPELGDKEIRLHPKGKFFYACEWNLINLFAENLRYANVKYKRIRYEDLAADPKGVLNSLLWWVGEMNGDQLDFIQGKQARMNPDHTVAGNPMRFQKGAVEIKPDIIWRYKMRPSVKCLITSLTWPLLLRYGYHIHAEEEAVIPRMEK